MCLHHSNTSHISTSPNMLIPSYSSLKLITNFKVTMHTAKPHHGFVYLTSSSPLQRLESLPGVSGLDRLYVALTIKCYELSLSKGWTFYVNSQCAVNCLLILDHHVFSLVIILVLWANLWFKCTWCSNSKVSSFLSKWSSFTVNAHRFSVCCSFITTSYT